LSSAEILRSETGPERLQRPTQLGIDETWRRKLTPLHLRSIELIAGRENRRLGSA